MLNYRLATTLLLLGIVVFPLALHWAVDPLGSWYRPFIIWALMIYAVYLAHRHGERDAQ